MPSKEIITIDIAETIAQITHEINKEIAIIINRRGHIINVTVGDAKNVKLPQFQNVREGLARLCGLRCIHTHPKDSPLSQVDLNTLQKLRFDTMIAISVDPTGTFSKKKGQQANYADTIYMAHLMPGRSGDNKSIKILEPQTLRNLVEEDFEDFILSIEEEFARGNLNLIQLQEEERAILVSLFKKGFSKFETGSSLKELENLAETAGAKVVHTLIQKKDTPDKSLYVGSGKAEEISLIIQEHNANIVIIDDELSPRQQKNLEAILGVKTIDRTELILDIFAQRARTREGKIQVELAQLKYLFPRLIGAGLSLSRQMGGGKSGGIATRGPGETKLETDRRAIRKRLQTLEKDVEQIRLTRKQQRRKRDSQRIPVIALVGYTNTGKSTFLNALSKSDVFVEDKLFATLDPTTRKIMLPDCSYVLVSDTVGFIQRLPTSLIAAFRATLEEVEEADILVNVVDSTHPHFDEQIETVYKILTELEVIEKLMITVYNKIDLLESPQDNLKDSFDNVSNPILISAKKKIGFNDFGYKIASILKEQSLKNI